MRGGGVRAQARTADDRKLRASNLLEGANGEVLDRSPPPELEVAAGFAVIPGALGRKIQSRHTAK